MQIPYAIELGVRFLRCAQFNDNAKREVKLLLKTICDVDDLSIIFEKSLSKKQFTDFKKALKRRASFEPLSRISGIREFYGLDFYVTPSVLDPRHETELLVDSFLKLYPHTNEQLFILDAFTGSGCVGITLLTIYKNAVVVATDISEAALTIAQKNAIKHNVNKRFYPVCTNITNGLQNNFFNAIVANPPYLTTTDVDKAPIEVRCFDPRLALDGGVDGYFFYHQLSKTGVKLKNRSYLLVECGQSQFQGVINIIAARDNDFLLNNVINDLAGIERCIIFQYK